MVLVSDTDIRCVAGKAELTRDDLHKLYGELDLTLAEIDRQERKANTRDYTLQAVHILSYWREKNGEVATRKTILDALHECNHVEAKQTLEGKYEWGCTDEGTCISFLPQDGFLFHFFLFVCLFVCLFFF